MINIHKNKHVLIRACLQPLAALLSERSEHPSLILLLLLSVRNSRRENLVISDSSLKDQTAEEQGRCGIHYEESLVSCGKPPQLWGCTFAA